MDGLASSGQQHSGTMKREETIKSRKMMFINNGHIVFSVFETGNLKDIEFFLREKKQNNYNLFYDKLDIEKDIIIKRGGAHFPKAIFFKPKLIDVIVQYSNYEDGLISLSTQISNNLNEPFYQFSFSNPDCLDKKFSMERYTNGEISRVVYVMQDPKWKFYEQGEILSFEDITNYEKKRIPSRLSKEIIIEYCARLGFEITSNNFWESAESAFFYECISWK